MIQVYTPNLNIKAVYEDGEKLKSWLGYCLAVTETMCDSARVGATAWKAWTDFTKFPRTDALPSGVIVPVYFSGYNGQGHVCLYEDGMCYSSPYTNKTSLDVVPFNQMSQKYGGIKYVGWAEDMVGKIIVEEDNVNDKVNSQGEADLIWTACIHKYDPEGSKGVIGMRWVDALTLVVNGDTWKEQDALINDNPPQYEPAPQMYIRKEK